MSFYATALTASIADVSPPGRRAEAMGVFNVANTGVQLYAPWLGLVIAGRAGFEWYWIATTAAMVACTAMAISTRQSQAPNREPRPLVARSAVRPFLVFTALTTGYSTLLAFLTPYAEEGLGDAGLWFVLFGLAMLAVRVSAGRLADRRGRSAVILPGICFSCAGLALLGTAQVPAGFYAAAVVIGVGFGSARTALMALTVDRAAAAERGAAIAVFLMGWDVGQALGTMPLGVVAGMTGYGPVFVLGGIATLAGIPLLRSATRGSATSVAPRRP